MKNRILGNNNIQVSAVGPSCKGGTESQVNGHIKYNLNVGNNKETLLSVTTQLLPYIGYPRTLNANKCINEIN